MNFVEAITAGFKGYVDFSGRALRSEYWYWSLFIWIVQIVLSLIYAPLGWVFMLATVLPTIAVGVRRLHDIDRSGWWMLISLVPLIGAIYLIVKFCTRGTDGPNRFGGPRLLEPSPPAPAAT